MTQRIFKAYDEKDVKELFSLFDDRLCFISKNHNHEPVVYERKQSSCGVICGLIKIDWGDLTEIKRPVDYSKYIGKLGWFGNDHIYKTLGIFFDKDERGFLMLEYVEGGGEALPYENFRPLTLKELKEKNLITEYEEE
jgi:hypothetical protein